MQADLGRQYQLARSIQESGPSPFPTEHEVQNLWFEQLCRPVLLTDAGLSIHLLQPGIWNHGPGPDFLQAAYRDHQGNLQAGPVEIHLRPGDWSVHGHDADPAYDATILHVVWEPGPRTFFPATRSFRQVPQVFLRDQLIAPWDHLRPLLEPPPSGHRPSSKAGPCQRELARRSRADILTVLRQVGEYRLHRKAERLRWRIQTAGFSQTLWEALAEALGYQHNKIPFRLIAQRVPWASLPASDPVENEARLFGLAGLLPTGDLKKYRPAVRTWLKPRWECWWKLRDQARHAVLPRNQWNLAGVRPLNRPERRLAALAKIVPVLPRLEKAVRKIQPESFADGLLGLRDPLWERQTTFASNPLKTAHQLLGEERVHDILLNVFWPLVSLDHPAPAREHAGKLRTAPNQPIRIARQRVLGGISLGPAGNEALVQQGLLQIYQDYCLEDASGCARCPFPDLIDQMVGF